MPLGFSMHVHISRSSDALGLIFGYVVPLMIPSTG
jgi:hypothetical protein